MIHEMNPIPLHQLLRRLADAMTAYHSVHFLNWPVAVVSSLPFEGLEYYREIQNLRIVNCLPQDIKMRAVFLTNKKVNSA